MPSQKHSIDRIARKGVRFTQGYAACQVSSTSQASILTGYRTFMAGKWHLGGKGSYPEDHGFDINIGGFEAGSPPGGYFSPYHNPKLTDGPKGEN